MAVYHGSSAALLDLDISATNVARVLSGPTLVWQREVPLPSGELVISVDGFLVIETDGFLVR